MYALTAARTALGFLTRIPVGNHAPSPEQMRWASAWFPCVGALLGALLAALWLALPGLEPWPRALLVITASLMLTGAFHEDGMADTCDAFGGGVKKFITLPQIGAEPARVFREQIHICGVQIDTKPRGTVSK